MFTDIATSLRSHMEAYDFQYIHFYDIQLNKFILKCKSEMICMFTLYFLDEINFFVEIQNMFVIRRVVIFFRFFFWIHFCVDDMKHISCEYFHAAKFVLIPFLWGNLTYVIFYFHCYCYYNDMKKLTHFNIVKHFLCRFASWSTTLLCSSCAANRAYVSIYHVFYTTAWWI